MKTYKIGLSHKDIEYLQGRFEDADKYLKKASEELCRRLAHMGVQTAKLHFFEALYERESVSGYHPGLFSTK